MKQFWFPVLLWALAVPAAVAQERAGTVEGPAGEGDAAARPREESAAASATMDRLELDSTVVTGNRELPKVMYVVPWKRADLGSPGGKPLNSLVEEVLTPVDRGTFEREVEYFRALDRAAAEQVVAPSAAQPGPP